MRKKTKVNYRKVVAIAKDALKQLNLRRYQATQCLLVDVCAADTERLSAGADSQQVRNWTRKLKNCRVCQKGALLVSKVRLYDSVSRSGLLCSSTDNIHDELPEFPKPLLDEAEILFERDVFTFHDPAENAYLLKDYAWDKLPENDAARMRVILKLLIKHKGRKIAAGTDAFEKWKKSPYGE